MSEKPIGPPRQRMLDDMSLREFTPDTVVQPDVHEAADNHRLHPI
jgi:hypothetical protein